MAIFLVIGLAFLFNNQIETKKEYSSYTIFTIANKNNAIAKEFEEILKKYIRLTMDLSGDHRKLVINDVPQGDSLNVLILNLDSLDKNNNIKLFGLTLSQFAKIINWNAVVWPDNLLIIDEKLIAAITFFAFNYTLHAYQFPSVVKDNRPLEANNIEYQREMISLGNTKAIINKTEMGNHFLEVARQLVLSIDQDISQHEVDEITPYLIDYMKKESLVEPGDNQKRVMWKILMTISSNDDPSKNSDMIYGAFVFLLAHELGHLKKLDGEFNPSGWVSIDDYIRYLKNVNQKAEEERADQFAKDIFKKYLKNITENQSISEENARIRLVATLSFAEYILNQALLDTFENFRDLTSQQLFYRVMSSDCRTNSKLKDVPFWYTHRLMSLSFDRPPIISINEVNNIRKEYYIKKLTSTHAHHYDRIRGYLSIIEGLNIITKSWIGQYYPFQKPILNLFSDDIDNVKSMIDPNRYNYSNISVSELLESIGLVHVKLEEGGNCPADRCWIGEFSYIDDFSIGGYIEIISQDNKIGNVKVVLNPKNLEQNYVIYEAVQRIGIKFIELFNDDLFFKERSEISLKSFIEQHRECTWASEIVSNSLVLRSVSENAIAIEAGDIFYDNLSKITEDNQFKMSSLGIGQDPDIRAFIVEAFDIHREKGFSGLEKAIIECRNQTYDINHFKRCLILQYTGVSLMESKKALVGKTYKYDIFTKENLINQISAGVKKIGIDNDHDLGLIKNWINIYKWQYSTVLLEKMNEMRNH